MRMLLRAKRSHLATSVWEHVPRGAVMKYPACVLLAAGWDGEVRGQALEVFVFREGLGRVTG